MDKKDILGVWLLDLFQHHYINKGNIETTSPWGTDVKGALVFTDGGYVSATLMKADRTKLGSKDIAKASSMEQANTAIAEYYSYFGKYTIVGDKVTMDVEMSLHPHLIGKKLGRTAKLKDNNNKMIIDTDAYEYDGKMQVAHLEWSRPKEDV